MTAFVLDASAVIRFIDNEAGADRVDELLNACEDGQALLFISAVQWGEIAGNLRKRFGAVAQDRILGNLTQFKAAIVPANADRAVHAASIRVNRKISYADAFALDLAMDSPDHVLVTADYGFKAVADLARIEFLPAK